MNETTKLRIFQGLTVLGAAASGVAWWLRHAELRERRRLLAAAVPPHVWVIGRTFYVDEPFVRRLQRQRYRPEQEDKGWEYFDLGDFAVKARRAEVDLRLPDQVGELFELDRDPEIGKLIKQMARMELVSIGATYKNLEDARAGRGFLG